ncbi:MAG TPA: cell wall hydrolase [Sphingomonas sp.]|uniref:cell wall hydrolase n=1 Tax=Sphingomonas sp. TaxID=28214 RepID=UPI002ED84B68
MPDNLAAPASSWWSAGVAATLLTLAIVVVAGQPPAVPGASRMRAVPAIPPATPAPAAPPPAVEPMMLRDMTPDRARAINAEIPFVGGPITAARPFRYAGSEADRSAAQACLASAAWYEAGDDPVGQPAVVQVVLNRVRHPAYPKTVCGVVFQGSERRTGCQFSFTCDGSMARRPSDAAWKRAEDVADKALAGFVDRRVGNATHYHTDWVVPYWSATLDKIGQVGTHLFFRWRGYWGTPAAFRRRYGGQEIVDPRVPGFGAADAIDPAAERMMFGVPAIPSDSVQHLETRPVVTIPGVPAALMKGNIVRLGTPGGNQFALELVIGASDEIYPAIAAALCGERAACMVAGWIDPDRVPARLPIPLPALRSASFVYRRAGDGTPQLRWNCRQIPRADPAQCLPGTSAP